MSKINNVREKSSRFKKEKKENKDTNSTNFCDILSFPSNPEDLFTLQYPIGHGAFGSVYKAVHNSTNKLYAIKIIDYSKDNNKDNNNMINYNYLSVQQETSIMRLVNQSDYIVKYYGSYFSRKSNTLWLILEYCSSGSAIDLMLSMDRTFSEVEVATIMEMVLQGLLLIHSKNLIHRDIKGANILLSEDGYAKLGDFGVGAQLLTEKYRKSKKGSPYWMSPQVASNIKYDFKTDIWSLGITCVELIEGEPPFSDMKPKNVMEKIAKNPPKVNEIIDFNEHTYEFKSFIEHCLEIDPKKRYSADELLNHDFIIKFSKGRRYMKDLIKKYEADIEKFRFESEEDYQKLLKINEKNKKNESINNEDNSEEEIFKGKMNCKGTYQECMNEDNFDSFEHKIEKLLKKKNEDKKDNAQFRNNEEVVNKLGVPKLFSDKINDFDGICYNESIIASEDKSSISKDKENIIILDKSIKKNKHKEKDNISTDLKIIKNYQIEIINNNKEEYNEDKKKFKSSENSCSSNKGYNLLYNHLTPNATTEDNSKSGSNGDSKRSNMASAIKEKSKKHTPNNSFDLVLDKDVEELHRKPKTFKNNSNDIFFLNNKAYDIKEENINDSDDEGTIHKTKDYYNCFKGFGIYQNKINPYSEPNICGYSKYYENKNSI